jgi:hypothetical protein
MGEANLNIQKLDMKKIGVTDNIIIIGKKGTGKSFLLRDLLFHHQEVPVAMVVSPTEETNGFFKTFMPKLFVHDECEPSLIANFLKRQQIIIEKIKKGKTNLNPHAFLILDDCMYDDSWKKDKNIRYIFMNGRHKKICIIITSQDPIGIPPKLRTNLDWIFLLREGMHKNRKKLYENYGNCLPSYEYFCKLLDACTENRECLVIHNSAPDNKIENSIYWYKASEHDFILGDPRYIDYAKKYKKKNNEATSNQLPVGKNVQINITKKGHEPNQG